MKHSRTGQPAAHLCAAPVGIAVRQRAAVQHVQALREAAVDGLTQRLRLLLPGRVLVCACSFFNFIMCTACTLYPKQGPVLYSHAARALPAHPVLAVQAIAACITRWKNWHGTANLEAGR